MSGWEEAEGEGRKGRRREGRREGMPPWEEDGRGDVDATLPHCHIARLPQHLSSDPLPGRGCHNDALLRITARHREYIA